MKNECGEGRGLEVRVDRDAGETLAEREAGGRHLGLELRGMWQGCVFLFTCVNMIATVYNSEHVIVLNGVNR